MINIKNYKIVFIQNDFLILQIKYHNNSYFSLTNRLLNKKKINLNHSHRIKIHQEKFNNGKMLTRFYKI